MTDQSNLSAKRQVLGAEILSMTEYRRGLDEWSRTETMPVTFHRRELDAILRIYGKMVGDGHWKDYAIDHLADRAVFSIFKRAGEMPLYRVEKRPEIANRQGAYCVIGTHGVILKRGRDLSKVLKILETKVLKIIK